MDSMKLSKKVLGQGENVVLHVRTHIKKLIPHIIAAVILVVAAVLAVVYLPEDWRPISTIVIVVVAVIAEIYIFIWPWMNWFASTYTVTNRRIITRKGVFTKTGHDIPLSRISDVAYEHSMLDRVFGCGTLVLQTSAADPLYLDDVPAVEKVHLMLLDMLFSRGNSQESAAHALPADDDDEETDTPAEHPIADTIPVDENRTPASDVNFHEEE